ncbi:PAS domain S-box protein [Flavitalea sp. BT771]|uniref:sensor histidine kinase n=1 Tax=Flavitalea sp. BT771 TaxID=3063329 RepID=UPI0026E2E708|nr:sensor histidine kinase [Flavitalea sp. BT771]MDO6429145.1 PAS domain S-box protein [Flavitalea sp. BT771]MDV6218727.1 PAS domain S-box protein [Flavitalea sp. BT771]
MKDVLDFFLKLLDSSDWPPRWHCGKWTDFHGWLYIISDLLIWSAYFAIPVIIIRFISRQSHQRYARLYFLFAGAILACGATHFLDALLFWVPVYRLSALVRAITAVISWLTVFSLIRLLPYAYSLKSPRSLEAEIERRKKTASDLQVKNLLLEESKQLFKNVFDYSAVGVALVSPEGRWLNVNQSICDMLGYSREELLKGSFQDITHPDDLVADMAFVTQMLNKEREHYQMEKRYIRKDGSILWVLLSVSLTWQEEKPAFFISQLTDISTKKALRLEVERKNAELEAHIVRINEFNRIVAHNLRGPASSLINMADYLEKNKNEEDRDFLLSKVKDTSVLIIHTLNDLKELLEIQLRQEEQSVAYSFKEALQTSMQMLDNELMSTDAVITTKFEVDEVLFPKAYLDSIFYNLLSNALKYRCQGKTPVIDISTKVHDGYILLTIQDNGIGIDMQKYGQDMFKYKKVFHKGYASNGVGLFITRNQLEANNGKIEVESAVDKGTLFRVYFEKKNII